jgi:transcription-repair coupling factor (superfamily II helicase)
LLQRQFLDYTIVELTANPLLKADTFVAFNTTPQPSFNRQFDLLIENLDENHAKGYTNYITCVSEQQAKRFHDIFDDV